MRTEKASKRLMVSLTPTQYEYVKKVAKEKYDYRISKAIRNIIQNVMDQ